LPSNPRSNVELKDLAVRGQAANAILSAFARDLAMPLNAPDFDAYLEHYRQEGSRGLTRSGYRLRLAEREVMGDRMLVPLGQIEEVLRSGRSRQEKTVTIAEYLDAHETVGLGDPVRLYVLAPFDDVGYALDCLVEQAIEANRSYISDLEMQTELCKRFFAYGYVYKVAEELVRKGLPEDWKPDEASAPELPEEEAKPKSMLLWAYFDGMHNSSTVLYEKARVVASLIDMEWSGVLILAGPARTQDKNSWNRLEEEQARSIISETAALLIRIVDEIAFSALGAESSDKFVEALIEFVARDLQGRGIEAVTFAELLKERLAEYAGYPKWVPKGDEGVKGTLFWEFGKKVADIMGIGKDPVFNLLLANMLMRSLADWHLPQLLPCVAG